MLVLVLAVVYDTPAQYRVMKRKTSVNVVLVDSCRECEFRDIGRGSTEPQSFLQTFTFESDTVIGLACAPTKTASDGAPGRKHGKADN